MQRDPAGKSYLKDIKLHFKKWLEKINKIFTHVLNQFLTVGEDQKGPSMKEIQPVLE